MIEICDDWMIGSKEILYIGLIIRYIDIIWMGNIRETNAIDGWLRSPMMIIDNGLFCTYWWTGCKRKEGKT